MENLYKYSVAGHTFAVCLPCGYSQEEYLQPYLPFICDEEDRKPMFTLRLAVVESLAELGVGKVCQCLNDEAPYFWMFEKGGGIYDFGFSYTKSHPDCILMTDGEYRDSVVYIPAAYSSRIAEFAVSNSMMLLYTFNTTPFDTLMVHASVISYDGGGYMFLGRSGTGKSTHSRMWLENIEGTSLLNDDNPAIRVIDGKVYVFGTPWSGKTPCYKNEVLPLNAVVRLSQAPQNVIKRLSPLQAYASLMPACSCMRWDRRSTDAIHRTVEKVVSLVNGWHLECLPDADAAYTCNAAVVPAEK